jgi:hypothetical protein
MPNKIAARAAFPPSTINQFPTQSGRRVAAVNATPLNTNGVPTIQPKVDPSRAGEGATLG